MSAHTKSVAIFDTTLRDGMQGLEINYSLEDKLSIAKKLDEIGIDYIEGGFPLSNDKEAAFFNHCKSMSFSHAKIASFGSTRKPGGKAESDGHIRALLEAQTPVVVIVGKTWMAHVEKVLGTTAKENLAMIADSISFLKREGREVVFDLEHFFDGYKDHRDYALEVLKTASHAGADVLVPCDTNGGTLPHEVSAIYEDLKSQSLAPLGGHFHNDCGTAVANSLAAVQGGAVHIQGTINGWGERCGNANLCAIMPNLTLKMGYHAACADHMEKLTSLSRFVAEKANIIPDKRQPYVGIASFSHKAGQHADVILKAAHLMEHLDGSLVGNHRQVLLSELAGKSTIVEKMKKYGSFEKNHPAVETLIRTLKDKENDGYEYEAAEGSFDLLMRQALGEYKQLIELKNYHLESYKTANAQSKTVGRMFLSDQGREVMGAAVCIGPVETLDGSLRDALSPHYPFLDGLRLTDYRVRVLNPESASAAKVRVFITSTNGDEEWTTVGVNENIVEASWEALVDSYEYYYNNHYEELPPEAR
ncbi:citramalate synthase [Spirochaeta lutea]|uniref:Citramalate synthase n=1 Tax=Spirochaeta lutea TaxID=1480694 RepID=A0A098R179_9SPIO|nr:citramalate synthase [Spirochaeta lutea]KGE73865.1 2-isopropylmalate synthase [Spirochaeta lutea]